MKFPEGFIKHGNFVLHSGGHSNIKYDVEDMERDRFAWTYLVSCIPFSLHYIGIETGGRKMVKALRSDVPWARISYVTKKDKLDGERPTGEWMLVDDVVTTGRSLLKAIAIVGSVPKEIVVAVDRRGWKEKIEGIEVKAIFEI